MRRDELGELVAFLAVCEERSFTRAAARLSTSQSALSHTVKRLEERLDLRLLTRTTRSVVPTEAGEQLAATLRPALDEIEARLDGLTALRARPAGTIRITSNRAAARDILYPKVARLMADYPDIRVEILGRPELRRHRRATLRRRRPPRRERRARHDRGADRAGQADAGGGARPATSRGPAGRRPRTT